MATATLTQRLAPEARGHFLLGNLQAYQRNPTRLFMDTALRYGPIARVRMAGRYVHFVSGPEGIKHILQDNNRNYHKGVSYDKIHPLVGNGLLTSEGEFWRRQRRLAQPAFHRQHIGAFATSMTDATGAMLERWDAQAKLGQPLDVAKEMMRLTLTIVGQTLFSTDVSGEADAVGNALTVALEHSTRRMQALFPLPDTLPTPDNRRFHEALATLDQVVYGMIAERRRTGEERNDLLGLLLAAQDDETGERMDDKQLRDEAMTIFLAGHETTANALAWTWYLLSKHPAVARQLRAEVQEVLGDRTPTMADLGALRYTKMVIEESMRLFPPAWAIGRTAIAADSVYGYDIPAGSMVALSSFVTHRLPEYWPNPEGFDPERFAPGRDAERPRFAYFPFGGGPRLCIGNNFAMMEAQLIVAMVVQRFSLHLVPSHPIALEPMVTLRPKYGVQMTLQPQV